MILGFKASCWAAEITGSTDWKVNSVAGRPPSPPSNLICGSQVPKSRAPVAEPALEFAFPLALVAALLVEALAFAFPALALLLLEAAFVAVAALDLVTVERVVAATAGAQAPWSTAALSVAACRRC